MRISDWSSDVCSSDLVGYGKRYRGFDVLADLRKLYDTDEIVRFDEWHDSFVWDRLREHWQAKGGTFHNISKGVPGLHVWPETPLGEFMDHHKGPKAKLEAYACRSIAWRESRSRISGRCLSMSRPSANW